MKKCRQLHIVYLSTLLAILVGCSPKITSTPNKNEKKEETLPTAAKPVKRFTEANISLLIPFKLDQINLKTANKAQVERADMAIDFYQGVLLGLDSAAATGLNYKVHVYDTKDEHSKLAEIVKKEAVKTSNLIIGPVFPEGVKYMTNFSIANDLPLVSPLAASKPSDFDNPKLISIVNNIDQHGARIADYIADHYQSNNSIVVLINPKKTADEQFAAPIRQRFRLKHSNFIVQEFTSAYAFETRMIKDKKYAVVICSADVPFVTPSVDKLFKLKKLANGGYAINLFGHPNWAKQNYNVNQLQELHTILSTSYRIDYKQQSVINFIKKYRAKYHFEPSEFSFKGFDIGYYFAKLLAKHGPVYLNYLTKEKYQGLHNSFDFAYDPKYGYINQDLMLIQYKNLTLSLVD